MNIKSVLMAGAAALASTASMAADLPSSKSAPVEYVRVCDVYGRGFFYIPGTQTCLKIGGYVRAEYSGLFGTQNAYNAVPNLTGPGGGARAPIYTSKNGQDSIGYEMRGILDLDARTQSAWGTVQTFMRLRMTSASGQYNTGYNTASYTGTNVVSVTLIRAFVRFGGFTFGRSGSLFNFDSYDQYVAHRRPGFANGTKQLAYTATFGSGFSATVGIEDRGDFNATRTANGLGPNTVNLGTINSTATGPNVLPAFTANVRVDQDWGAIQVMATALENTTNIAAPAVLGITNANGPLIRKWGYAVGMGAKIKLPMIGPGDELMVTATAGKGAMDTVSNFSTSAITSDLGHILTGLTRTDMNMYAYGPTATTVATELTSAWAVSGMFKHYWTPSIASLVGASYVSITPGINTRNTDWQQGGLGKANAYTLSKALIWYPISGFEIGGEIGYYRLNQTVATNPGALPSGVAVAAACPGGIAGCSPYAANFKVNPNAWRFTIRAERRF